MRSHFLIRPSLVLDNEILVFPQVFGPSDAVEFVQKLLKVPTHFHLSRSFHLHILAADNSMF